MSYYTRTVTTPASKRQGLANAVQIAINSLEAGHGNETLLQLVNLLDDIRSVCNPYELNTAGENATPARVLRLAPVAAYCSPDDDTGANGPHDPANIAPLPSQDEADGIVREMLAAEQSGTFPAAVAAPSLLDVIEAVFLANVPVVCRDRHIDRKEQAKLARKLFKTLGLKGISVTTPNYSMASVVEVAVPSGPHPGWAGFEQWENSCFSDMPANVPAKIAHLRHYAATQKIAAILAKAFPNHDDRGEMQSDYHDSCWSIS